MSGQTTSLPKSAHLMSLGCPKNLVDSEIMLGQLRKMGIGVSANPHAADLIIVNTCGFIDAAKKESVGAILDLARYKREGACRGLIVSGCLAQLYKTELAKELPEVDAFLGPGECGKIGSIVQDVWGKVAGEKSYPLMPEEPFQYISRKGRPQWLYDHDAPRLQLTPKHYAYVKVSEGCDNPCKFCIIPRLRGPFRSRGMESIVAEVRRMVDNGVVEVILIAQDLTDYGKDLYGKRCLSDLLEKINAVEGLRWIRLLYAYPAHVTEDFIAALAGLPKVCKYLDLPVQHLNDAMLLNMGRRLGNRQTKALIGRLRERVAGLALRTSLIVGMPGETNEIFQELLRDVQEVRFDRLGVFTYSREEGTAAYRMAVQVPESVKKRRRALVMACQQKIARGINERLLGRVVDVLVDGQIQGEPGVFVGRTQWDAPGIDNTVTVRTQGQSLRAGDIVRVEIDRAAAYDLEGSPVAQYSQSAYSA